MAVAGPLLAVRIVNPLHVLGNRLSVSDIDGLKIFKLYEHPEIWKETIEGKKGLSTLRFGKRQSKARKGSAP